MEYAGTYAGSRECGRRIPVEPAYKDILPTSDLLRIMKTFIGNPGYKDNCSLTVAFSL
jgi:hypothetical protein